MNDLVAKPQDDGKMFTGAGPLDTMEDIGANLNNPAETIKKDTNGDGVDEELRKEIEPVQLGIDVASLGLDAAGAVVDPLGTLASSAVGWIIENVGFIREPFDDLAGDPPAIEAASNTFKNISDHLKEVGEQYEAALRDVDSWQEQSGEAYRGEAKTLAGHVTNASAGAATAASKIKTAGVCVAATRALIRDLIAELRDVVDLGLARDGRVRPNRRRFGGGLHHPSGDQGRRDRGQDRSAPQDPLPRARRAWWGRARCHRCAAPPR